MNEFLKGMATIGELSPPPTPIKKYPSQYSEWQWVAHSFAQTGNNIRSAMLKETQENVRRENKQSK
jgi:hypothetical protein